MFKKTIILTVVICVIAALPVAIPNSDQATVSQPTTISLVSTANALPPDCDDGIFSAGCVRAILMDLFGGRDTWFD
jgi:hypothetical protein